MKKVELLGKELSNLYAIAKQVIHYFEENETSFLSKKVQNIIIQYVKFCEANKEQVSNILMNLEVNPGNTTDSIVEEITENLQSIAVQKGSSTEVRQLGFTMSLNRLISYHRANLENLDAWNHMVV